MATTTRKTRKTPKDAPTVVLTYAQFDTAGFGSRAAGENVLDVVRDGQPISQWQPLALGDFTPRGGTPLYDAVGLMVAHMEGVQAKNPEAAHIAVLVDRSGSMSSIREQVVEGINEFVGAMSAVKDDEVDAQGKLLMLIYTDGGENSSTEYKADDVAKLVKAHEAAGWEFIYLGANQDAWQVGGSMGIGASTGFVASASGTRSAMKTTSNVGTSYLSDNAAIGSRMAAVSSSALGEDEVREVPKSQKKKGT